MRMWTHRTWKWDRWEDKRNIIRSKESYNNREYNPVEKENKERRDIKVRVKLLWHVCLPEKSMGGGAHLHLLLPQQRRPWWCDEKEIHNLIMRNPNWMSYFGAVIVRSRLHVVDRIEKREIHSAFQEHFLFVCFLGLSSNSNSFELKRN